MHDFNARNTRILTDFVQNMRFLFQIRYSKFLYELLKCEKMYSRMHTNLFWSIFQIYFASTTATFEKHLTRKWIKHRFISKWKPNLSQTKLDQKGAQVVTKTVYLDICKRLLLLPKRKIQFWSILPWRWKRADEKRRRTELQSRAKGPNV